jgi:hypothetical protein
VSDGHAEVVLSAEPGLANSDPADSVLLAGQMAPDAPTGSSGHTDPAALGEPDALAEPGVRFGSLDSGAAGAPAPGAAVSREEAESADVNLGADFSAGVNRGDAVSPGVNCGAEEADGTGGGGAAPGLSLAGVAGVSLGAAFPLGMNTGFAWLPAAPAVAGPAAAGPEAAALAVAAVRPAGAVLSASPAAACWPLGMNTGFGALAPPAGAALAAAHGSEALTVSPDQAEPDGLNDPDGLSDPAEPDARDVAPLLSSADWPSSSSRLLCAPICTTSSSPASLNTTEQYRLPVGRRKVHELAGHAHSPCYDAASASRVANAGHNNSPPGMSSRADCGEAVSRLAGHPSTVTRLP